MHVFENLYSPHMVELRSNNKGVVDIFIVQYLENFLTNMAVKEFLKIGSYLPKL